MKHNIEKYVMLVILVSFLFSCKKEDSAALLSREKSQIDNYLAVNNIHLKPTTSGLYFQSTMEGTGEPPSLNDFVTINYEATTLDGKLIATNNDSIATHNNITASSAIDGPIKLYMQGITIKGLIEGLSQMKEGGTAWMLMPSSLTFNDYIPRIYVVTLVKVIHDPIAYEDEKIRNYLDTIGQSLSPPSLSYSYADSTSDGIYYIETLAGTGANVKDGDMINVSYRLNLIDGQLINSNSNFTCTVGDPSLISGFNIGIKKMKKGGKAILIIPYDKAYGITGVNQNGTIMVPMYATLVYHIEIKNIATTLGYQ